MKKISSILFTISVALFMGSIALSLLGRAFCTRSNDNYKEIQPESFVPDMIEIVLHDEELGQLYVCYDDANCVNVYSESGEFLWAVATPYLRNSDFELVDDKLIIYDGDAYIYNSETGEFLGLDNEENLELSYNWQNEPATQYKEGDFLFDAFQVYRVAADGTIEAIVSRPWWHNLFNYSLGLGIAFIGAAGIGISIFSEKMRDYKSVKNSVVFKNKKA